MKTMIVVRGAGNSGKTRSIRKVYELIKKLAESYKSLKIEEKCYCKRSNDDFMAVFGYSGKIIGIESVGDPGSEHSKKLKQLADEYKCDIIVAASRTGGETIDSVRSFQKDYDCDLYMVTSMLICEKAEKNEKFFDSWNESIAIGIIKLIDELI